MKVHTLVETEESFSDPLSADVVGSYESLYFARNALANRILARAQEDAGFSYALWHDVNHGEDLRGFMRDETGREDVGSFFSRFDEKKEFPGDVERALVSFLLDCVAGEECYHVFVDDAAQHTVHFDIKENELREGAQK